MRTHTITATIACLVFLGTVQYAFGAAVMSVDLGCEWIKVKENYFKFFFLQIEKNIVFFVLEVGVVAPGISMDIALNKESKRKTPAIIAFRDGKRSFGEDAMTVGLRFPSNSFYYLLDLLGKSVDNPIVKAYQKRFPYYKIESDPDRNTLLFKVDDTKHSVEELIAQMLQKAKDFAEDATGKVVVSYRLRGTSVKTILFNSRSTSN